MALRILKTSALLLLLLLPGFILSSCKKDSPVEVKKEEPTETPDTSHPGRRDYEWKLDTLRMPMNYVSSIWGSAPDDVWAVGPGGVPGEEVWHYDGVKWRPSSKGTANGYSIYGFSKYNVWMACRSGEIWHFTGKYWDIDYIYKVEGAYTIDILSICGKSENDIYASGEIIYKTTKTIQGFILHYNGYTWSEVYRGEMQSSYLIKIAGDKYYAWTYYYMSDNTNLLYRYKLFEYKNNAMRPIDIGFNDTHLFITAVIDGKLYIWKSNTMYLLENDKLKTILEVQDPDYENYSFGRSLRDMFVTFRTSLAHYNGEDVTEVYKYPNQKNLQHRGSIIFDKEVFLALEGDDGQDFVLHGKLKE